MPTTSDTILAELPATGLWGEVQQERVPTEGLLIQRDGEPGEPEVALSPLAHHYLHRAEKRGGCAKRET